MSRRWMPLALAAIFLVACTDTHEGEDAGPMGMDAATSDAGTDAGPPDVDSSTGRDAGEPDDAGLEMCGGGLCTTGLRCCFSTGVCYDPADPLGCTGTLPDASLPDASLPLLDGSIATRCIPACTSPMFCCVITGLCCLPDDPACCVRRP